MQVPGKRWAATTIVAAAGILVAWASAQDAKPPAAPDVPPPAAPAAPAVEAPDFTGKYIADGVGNAGKRYRAMVEITRDRDMYDVVWVLSPREQYRGVGLSQADTLCVGWATGDTPGVIVYESRDGKLHGRWTAPGADGKTFKETLTPVK